MKDHHSSRLQNTWLEMEKICKHIFTKKEHDPKKGGKKFLQAWRDHTNARAMESSLISDFPSGTCTCPGDWQGNLCLAKATLSPYWHSSHALQGLHLWILGHNVRWTVVRACVVNIMDTLTSVGVNITTAVFDWEALKELSVGSNVILRCRSCDRRGSSSHLDIDIQQSILMKILNPVYHTQFLEGKDFVQVKSRKKTTSHNKTNDK